MALPSLRSSRPPPSWVPLLHAHYGRFLARTDPLPPVRAALRLFPEHEHRPSPHRTGLPPSRPHPLWPFRRQSPDGPAPSLLRATLQRGARTESPLSDFAFYPAGSSDASGRIAFVILRTGPPPPIAPHAASRRRSYRQFQAGERMPGEDLHLSGCVRLEAHRVGLRSRPTWRRFATPVEPLSVFLRFFVSPWLAVTSVCSVASSPGTQNLGYTLQRCAARNPASASRRSDRPEDDAL